MTYSELRVDMRIRHQQTNETAVVAAIKNGKFQIVDQNGHVDILPREDAGNWEKA
jgi:hypothetical protein